MAADHLQRFHREVPVPEGAVLLDHDQRVGPAQTVIVEATFAALDRTAACLAERAARLVVAVGFAPDGEPLGLELTALAATVELRTFVAAGRRLSIEVVSSPAGLGLDYAWEYRPGRVPRCRRTGWSRVDRWSHTRPVPMCNGGPDHDRR